MKKGFTLVELSIALVIIGLLIGGSVQMMSMLSKRAKVTEAKQQLDTLKERIIGYVQTNQKLPTLADLGNPTDPWGKPIGYYGVNTDSICDETTTALKTTIDGVDSVQNIAFALVSSGANRNMQTTLDSGKITLSTPENKSVDYNTTDIGGERLEEYDDHSVVVNLHELQSMIDCQNQSNKFKIINTVMPFGTVDTDYNLSTTVVTSGGTPTCSSPPVAPCDFNVSGLPANLSYNDAFNSITGKPQVSGNYTLKLTASNGKANDEKLVLLVISDPRAVDQNTAGGGTSAYQLCVDTCMVLHSNETAQENCIKNTCKKLK